MVVSGEGQSVRMKTNEPAIGRLDQGRGLLEQQGAAERATVYYRPQRLG